MGMVLAAVHVCRLDPYLQNSEEERPIPID